MTYYL